MPQLLPLREGEELPFFVVRGRKPPKAMVNYLLSHRNVLLVFGGCLFFLFFYLQVLNLPQELATDPTLKLDSRNIDKHPLHIEASKAVLNLNHENNFTGPTNEKQAAVRDAFMHAWNGYRKYAWGHDHLRPNSRTYNDWLGLGLTIVDSLDVLIIMNLENEFEEAKEWVRTTLNFEKNRLVNLFETSIRALGGLLSAYHLSNEKIFLEKAEDLARRLASSISSNTQSVIPFSDANLMMGIGRHLGWGGGSSLSEVTSIQLEFRDISRCTDNNTYEKIAFRISEHVHKIGCLKYEGLCGMFISPNDGNFQEPMTITLGARTDSYYEYLLKQWIQTGKTINWLRDDYVKAVDAIYRKLWRFSKPNDFAFIGEILGGEQFSPKMDHLVCYFAGTLALGVQNGLPQFHLELAKNLSRTCYEMYNTTTGLAPEIVYFTTQEGVSNMDIVIRPLDTHSLLRPEAVEAWFYMYRITGNKQYQDWGWNVFKAIEKFAKIGSGGYSSINNVKKVPVTYRDMMESFFLTETLKYLYLLLADDQNILPLNKYVFNTEAHPLPIYSL